MVKRKNTPENEDKMESKLASRIQQRNTATTDPPVEVDLSTFGENTSLIKNTDDGKNKN